MIQISGVIGLSILKKNNKYYIIFYDDHSNDSYCKDQLIFISDLFDFLNKKVNNISFYIEDYYENYEDKYIWKESIHLEKINNLLIDNKNKNNWYFTDIRLYLGNNIGDNINNLDYLFNLSDTTSNNNLFKIKKQFNLFKDLDIFNSSFQNLYNKYIIIKKEIIKNSDDVNLYNYYFKAYLINNSIFSDKIYELDLLIDSLMELYTICIVNTTKQKFNILFYGLFHSVNFSYFLKESDCEVIFTTGITSNNFNKKFNLNKLKNSKSCIKIDINYLKTLFI